MPLAKSPPPTLDISEIREQLDALVDGVARRQARVFVARSGTPIAALVSVEELARLDRFDRERAERQAALEAMRAPFRDVPPEEIERETDRIIADLRRQQNDEQRARAAVSR